MISCRQKEQKKANQIQEVQMNFADCKQNASPCIYCDGSKESKWERQRWVGEWGGCLGSGWGSLRHLGWTQKSPSLYKQPSASASAPVPSCHLVRKSQVLGHSAENVNKMSFWYNLSCTPASAYITTPLPHPLPISAISKVNTPLNAGLTHFHCGWLCFQFSHHLSLPCTLEETRKLFLSRKQQKNKK